MLNSILKDVFLRKKRKLIQRNFSPQLFVSNEIQNEFIKNGIVHLKNIIDQETISNLIDVHNSIQTKETYENTNYYFNTISFQDKQIRKLVLDSTIKILQPTISKFLDTDNAKFPLGGNLCISPPNATRGCGLHQDPTLVDETRSYSITIWIPLVDTNIENGCLHFINGSHLWGNFHRSMSLKSAFDDYINYLWQYAKPITTKVGDILCFDSSILHGSTTNKTDKIRLAVNIPFFPKETGMISYFPANSILQNKAEKYNIDEEYFINESQYERPSSKYELEKIFSLDNYYTQKNIEELLLETSIFLNQKTS